MADGSSTPEDGVIEEIMMIDDDQEREEIEEAEENNGRRKACRTQEQQQLDFIISVGIVKDCQLSIPYWVELTNDKWNLFLCVPYHFEDIFSGYLKEGEDVIEGIQVNVYDKSGHEFEMMLKKWVKDSSPYYVLNRGWFSFCNQHGLKENDFIAIRSFRHGITDKLSFAVTYQKMS